MQNKRLLILSDGKPGHHNQAIAFAKHLGCEYDLSQVSFASRLLKAVSYLADSLGLCLPALCQLENIDGPYRAVVSAGSATYYANRVLANKLDAKSVAIMLPKGYRYDFDLIVAQQHDKPPLRENILSLPINLTFAEPQGIVSPKDEERYVSVIIGGDSKHTPLDVEELKRQLKTIFTQFPDHKLWLTTSRRTSPEVEQMLRGFDFSWALYYSEHQLNPIADFLQHSDYVFLTSDSTSMISEAVSFGNACVELLPQGEISAMPAKIARFIDGLVAQDCVHLFDGRCGKSREKVNLAELLRSRLKDIKVE